MGGESPTGDFNASFGGLPNDLGGGGRPLVLAALSAGTKRAESVLWGVCAVGGASSELACEAGLAVSVEAGPDASRAVPRSGVGGSVWGTSPASCLAIELGEAVSLGLDSLSVPAPAVDSALVGVSDSCGLRLVTVCITASVPKPRNKPTAARRPIIERLMRRRLVVDSDSVISVPKSWCNSRWRRIGRTPRGAASGWKAGLESPGEF